MMRSVVRPVVVIFANWALFVLLMMEAMGAPGLATPMGREIALAVIGIAGLVNAEWFAERGVRRIMADRRKAK